MSNTTISIDKETKAKAANKAKQDKLTVSAIARILLNDYADGNIIIRSYSRFTANGFTPEFEEAVIKAEHDEDVTFDSTQEAIDYLHSIDS